jgi:hypothetical protein
VHGNVIIDIVLFLMVIEISALNVLNELKLIFQREDVKMMRIQYIIVKIDFSGHEIM